jgi:putative heme-binding domain-containing protein
LPKGALTVTVTSRIPLEATLGGEDPAPRGGSGPSAEPAVFRLESNGDPTLLTIALRTRPGEQPPTLEVSYAWDDPKHSATLARKQLLLPWVPPPPPTPGPLENVPSLEGGDAKLGAAVFTSTDAKCATCHKVRGEGGVVGPDLSDVHLRDRLSVYRDIAEPSSRIHPDYLSYTVALKDGRILVGTVRAEGADAIKVTDTEAKATVAPRALVEELRPSATSIMPVGLAGALGQDRLRDLIAFLTAPAAAGGK